MAIVIDDKTAETAETARPPRPAGNGLVGWMGMCSALALLPLRCEPSTRRPSTGS